jgi:hypothetical protein
MFYSQFVYFGALRPEETSASHRGGAPALQHPFEMPQQKQVKDNKNRLIETALIGCSS